LNVNRPFKPRWTFLWTKSSRKHNDHCFTT
jgi:hypothetical protein